MEVDHSAVVVLDAGQRDLRALVEPLLDARIGAVRDPATEAGILPCQAAFEAMDGDPSHLLPACEHAGRVVAMARLSFIPRLSRGGAWCAQSEAVRTRADHCGRGRGGKFIERAIARARGQRCSILLLTTDKPRPEAHRCYVRLGFTASHEGMKLLLEWAWHVDSADLAPEWCPEEAAWHVAG